MHEVLVLGATGRTGHFLASTLQARGVAVRALVRDAQSASKVLTAETQLVEGDLRDADSLARAAEGCRRIVFLAGANGGVGRGVPREVEFEAVARLIGLLDPARMERFVLLSSAGVTQPEHPHNCTFNSVLKWKWRGEQALRASGVPYVVVRSLGLRDRPGGQSGIRVVQGDRIAFGEDIAREDVASFLADVIVPEKATGFAPDVQSSDLASATFEIFNDATIASGRWLLPPDGLQADAPILTEAASHG